MLKITIYTNIKIMVTTDKLILKCLNIKYINIKIYYFVLIMKKNSHKIYLHSTFHSAHCFKAVLKKNHDVYALIYTFLYKEMANNVQ